MGWGMVGTVMEWGQGCNRDCDGMVMRTGRDEDRYWCEIEIRMEMR